MAHINMIAAVQCSPRIIQGMTGGRGLGVACDHIKAFGLFPFPHQRKTCSDRRLAGPTCLKYIGENTVTDPLTC